MSTVVIGGSGLIGNAICRHLWVPDHEVYNYDFTQKTLSYFFDAKERPFHHYLTLSTNMRVFIDCARYDNQADQFLMWDTAINYFKRQNYGRIILFSSIYGHKAPDFSIYHGTEIKETPLEYAFTKGGTEQAVRYLAQKLKPWNIQVNAIAPGGVRDQHTEDFQRQYQASGNAPMIEPKNILPVVDMLLHPDNAVNGQVITVDGGWSL